MSSDERRNFDFFRLQTAQDFPGLFPCDFWTSAVLQVSHSEPAVLHASIALSALHQKSVIGGMSAPMQDMTDKVVQFSLFQFNKAISLLHKRLQDTPDRETGRVLLLCCILFISIEILRGHYGTAMLHLYNGRNILYNHLAHSRYVGREDTLVLSSTSQSVEDELVEIFARLDIQSTNFGLNAPRFRLITENLSTSKEAQIPHSFSGLREARQHFDMIANAIHRFLTMSADPEFHNPANPSAVAQQTDLLTKLQGWSQAFEKLLPRLSTGPAQHPDSNATLRETKTALLLRLHHTFLRVKLSVGLACGVETTYDKFIADFNVIVSLAEDLIGIGRQTGSGSPPLPLPLPTFFLDVGLIQPVYFTAIKCRNPKLRRRALAVLSSHPHREGMWDATLLATIAARIIQLEEVAASTLAGGQQTGLLPESARFWEVRILLLGEGDAGAALYCKQRHSDFLGDAIVRKEYCAFDGGALVRELRRN